MGIKRESTKGCIFCGRNFFTDKINKQAYCSIECYREHTKEQTKHRILAYYDECIGTGKTYSEMAKDLGYKVPSQFQQICKENGRGKPLTKFQCQVKELREQGKCSSEIAEILNKDTRQINSTAKAIGMPFTEEEKQMSIAIGKMKCAEKLTKNEKDIQDYIDRYTDQWEYVSGYIDCESPVLVRCKVCDTECIKSMITIRHSKCNARCDNCYQKELSLKRQQAKEKAELIADTFNYRYTIKHRKNRKIVLEIKKCIECGKAYATYKHRSKVCSDKCRKRRLNRYNDKRINRHNTIDRDITLPRLYQRDKGICYICGCTCDWEDSRTVNGAFVVGGSYPTVEHVIPLCKGGKHSWDNIKLACFKCNTKKGTRSA